MVNARRSGALAAILIVQTALISGLIFERRRAKRAEATVELLCDFAKEGRQLLFFTCHEHIKQMFVQASVDIRMLPAHGKPGTKIPRRWHSVG